MNFVKKNANDFTIAWIHREPKTILEYANSGERQALQWLYVLGGNLQITYSMNGYDGSYNLTSGVLADLRPINGLDTTWISAEDNCHCVGFMSADHSKEYEAENKNITDIKTITAIDRDRYFVPLIPGVSFNKNLIHVSSYVKILANRGVIIQADIPGSSVLVFTRIDE
jgi:hypothetical protein